MKTIYKIAKTELQTLFYSPVAWLVIVIFIFQTGMTFTNMMDNMVRNLSLGYEGGAFTSNVFANTWGGSTPSHSRLSLPLYSIADDGTDEPRVWQRLHQTALFIARDQYADYFRQVPLHDDLWFGAGFSCQHIHAFWCIYNQGL